MAHAEDHGHCVATWTMVVLELVGATMIGLGIALPRNWLIIPGVVVLVVGVVAWRLLAAAGLGEPVRHGPRIEAR